MNFAQFEESIASVALRSLARHWNEARGNRAMPAWGDIKPERIVNVLPIIWAYTYDAQNDVFTGRLAGDRIVQAFGKSFRASPLAAIQPPEAFPWIHQLLRRVVTEPAAYRGAGRVFHQYDRYGRGERIILPLTGAQGGGVLGATDYHRSDILPGIAAGPVGESETWFPLAT
jgi:hypothetical protein